jgi:DNA primase
VGSLLSREKVNEVRDRTNIVEVIRRHVELKRAGTNWKGLCPFHAEKTPSFNVNESRQIFYCFGCGEKGDVLSFVMKVESCSFPEALRSLAKDAGIELPERTMSPAEREEASFKEQMAHAVEMATRFFEEQLQAPAGAAARAYISGRGISDAVAKRFRLGYAPQSWGLLERHLAAQKVSLQAAIGAGLLGENERGRYDFFRDRVMLPVIDRQKRAVGFSSRLLDPDAKERKYVNSQESVVFHKKESLYGLSAAADPIRRSREAIVVEGNFDVLALHEAGFENAVAPMGTALTSDQVRLLARMADRVIVIFDGDEAGIRAARKAVPLFIEAEMDGRVARLPAGQDPDDFVRREGAEVFKRLAASALPVVEHFIDDLARRAEATIPGRMSALEEAAPLMARVRNPTLRELYVGRLASTLGLSSAQVMRAVRAASAGRQVESVASAAASASAAVVASAKRKPARDELEAVVLLVAHPSLGASADATRVFDLLTDEGLRPLCRSALEALRTSERIDVSSWLDAGPADIRDAVMEALTDGRFDGIPDASRMLRALVVRLEKGRLDQEISDMKLALERARQSGDQEAVRAISMRQMELFRIQKGLGEAPLRP